MNKRRFICLLLISIAAVLLTSVASARADGEPPGDGGVTKWGEDYVLAAGECLEDDLVVFDGDVTLEPGSCVEGSVVVWGGEVEVKGVIEEGLVVSGGDIHLSDTARVDGGVVCSWDCDLTQDDGARIKGGIVEGVPVPELDFEERFGFPFPVSPPPNFRIVGVASALNLALEVIRGVLSVLVVAVLAGLVALIWPQQVARIGQAVIESPGPSLGIGALTVVAAVPLIAVLVLTICLSPAALLAALALGTAGLFGWIGIGALVGERLLHHLDVRETVPLWAAGLGTLVITLVSIGLNVTLCLAPLGWALILGLGGLGLGAVVLTRFGAMSYP